MRMKRECFTVLLIVTLLLQDPFVSRTNRLLKEMGLWREQDTIYSLSEHVIETKSGDFTDKFKIQYFLNGGANPQSNPLTLCKENLPVALAVPVRDGYNFAGWYTDSGYRNKITEISQENMDNYTLYAKWTKHIDGRYNVQMYSYQNTMAKGRRNKKLKNCSYDFVEEIKIPGMPTTRESDAAENRITDTSVCPQGICLTKDYILVSAYTSNRSETLGCVHVFDKKNGEYLVTLGMKKESHLGGLTFDGDNIWVCHSDNSTLECIPYDFVKRIAAKKSKSVVDCTSWFESFHVSNSPSCITFYDGKLWVATHTKILNSVMIAYKPTEKGLKKVDTYRIPDKVQGVAFDDKGRVYLSTSYGRQNSSYLKVYDSLERMNKKPAHPMVKVEMPPCSEEIDMEDGRIYVLFESASEKYFEGTDGKGTSVSPIDQILTLSKSSIFQ